MSPEERELLNRSVNLAEENNKILLSMKHSMLVSRIMTFIYWIFIIGSAVGAYYFLQPYIDQLKDVYSGADNALNNFRKLSQ